MNDIATAPLPNLAKLVSSKASEQALPEDMTFATAWAKSDNDSGELPNEAFIEPQQADAPVDPAQQPALAGEGEAQEPKTESTAIQMVPDAMQLVTVAEPPRKPNPIQMQVNDGPEPVSNGVNPANEKAVIGKKTPDFSPGSVLPGSAVDGVEKMAVDASRPSTDLSVPNAKTSTNPSPSGQWSPQWEMPFDSNHKSPSAGHAGASQDGVTEHLNPDEGPANTARLDTPSVPEPALGGRDHNGKITGPTVGGSPAEAPADLRPQTNQLPTQNNSRADLPQPAANMGSQSGFIPDPLTAKALDHHRDFDNQKTLKSDFQPERTPHTKQGEVTTIHRPLDAPPTLGGSAPLASNSPLYPKAIDVRSSPFEPEFTVSGTVATTPAAPSGGVTSFTAYGKPIVHHIASQISAAVTQMSAGTTQIALNPEELGRIRITLAPSDAGMSVSIIAERPETADLMRRNIDALAADFIQLGHDNVSFSFDGSNDASTHDDTQENDASEPFGSPDDTPPPQQVMMTLSGGLDLKL